jgi:hypothetical protein
VLNWDFNFGSLFKGKSTLQALVSANHTLLLDRYKFEQCFDNGIKLLYKTLHLLLIILIPLKGSRVLSINPTGLNVIT